MAALSVAVVAAITLGITLATGLAALRDMGRMHATALSMGARDRMAGMFGEATSTLLNLADVTATHAWAMPSDDNVTLTTLETVHRSLFLRANGTVRGIQSFYRDNTQILYTQSDTDDMYLRVLITASPFSTTFPNSTLSLLFDAWNTSNGKLLPYSDPRIERLPRYSTFRVSDGLWSHVLLPSTLNGSTGVMGVLAMSDSLNSTNLYVICGMPTYRLGDRRTPDNVFAISIASFGLRYISEFLASMTGTLNSVTAAYDQAGYIIGSSVNSDIPYFKVYGSLPATSALLAGCTTTSTPYFEAYGKLVPRWACRTHLRSFDANNIDSLYTNNRDVFDSDTERVDILAAGTHQYFVAVAPVPLQFPGMAVRVAMVMPEYDVIGHVVEGRNVSIVVTCVIFVIVATLNACLVTVLLGPLSVIARRMLAAAHFEDGVARDKFSPLVEVRDLQAAYFRMNDELLRIRSYVPQTILAARRVERGHHDADEPTEPSLQTPSGQQSNEFSCSGISSGSGDTRDSHGTDLGVPMMTPMEGLRQLPVTVFSANLVAFHEALGERTFVDLAHGMAKVVSVLEIAVMQRLGVLSFHGDHFWAVFNSAKPCLMHARRACEAALEVAEQLPRLMPLQRSIRIGVATGNCVVGTIGSPTLKTFSTMGSAYSQASRLDAIARRFGLSVIATEHSLNESQGMFEYRYVDYPSLPCGRYGRYAHSLVAELLRRRANPGEGMSNSTVVDREQEWTYVIGSDSQAVTIQRNRAFELLSRGRVDRAKQIVLSQGLSHGNPRGYADTLHDLLGLDAAAFAAADAKIDLQQVRFTLPDSSGDKPAMNAASSDSPRRGFARIVPTADVVAAADDTTKPNSPSRDQLRPVDAVEGVALAHLREPKANVVTPHDTTAAAAPFLIVNRVSAEPTNATTATNSTSLMEGDATAIKMEPDDVVDDHEDDKGRNENVFPPD